LSEVTSAVVFDAVMIIKKLMGMCR